MNTIAQNQPETQNQPIADFPPAPPRASTEQALRGKGKRRFSSKRQAEIQAEALYNATCRESLLNYATIFEEFSARGIPMDEIIPRVNVFTFNAWKALGRTVKKGEHGVRVLTFVPCEKKDEETGETSEFLRSRTTTVFHVSQTKEMERNG